MTLALDRAGLVGGDGATHNGCFDLSYLRCVPNLVVMAPCDENECRQMLYTAYQYEGPALVRYPRGQGMGVAVNDVMTAMPIGKAEIKRQGKTVGAGLVSARCLGSSTKKRVDTRPTPTAPEIALLVFGSLLAPALQAAEKLNATVVNMRFVKPLDTALLAQIVESHELLVTIEENVIAGGAGSAVNEWLASEGYLIHILNLGLPDRFVEHGDPKTLLASCGLDAEGICQSIEATPGARAARLLSHESPPSYPYHPLQNIAPTPSGLFLFYWEDLQ